MIGEDCDARLTALVFSFTFGMLLFEICMEALFSLPDVPRTMSLWNTTVQFSFCAIIPALYSLSQGRGPSTGRSSDVEVGCPTDVAKPNVEVQISFRGLIRTWAPFLVLSMMQFAAGVAANHAVHFVDFTMKVVSKASKLLPTMVISSVVGNSRSYTATEYFAAVMLCGGTAVFSCGSSREGSGIGESAHADFIYGMLLLAFAVIADGIMPNMQQAMLRRGCGPDELTFRINIAGAVGGILGLTISGDWRRMAAYAESMPCAIPLLLASGFTFSISVMSYMRLIEEAGSVYAVGVSTVRKSVTVFLSFMLFPGKAFNSTRGAGLVAVLGGLVVVELEAARARRRAPGQKPEKEAAAAWVSVAHFRVRGG
uniref:EamA domain-containing protein n=1 Tax=Alexandrium catenella TaxID=2925 RepID=A0A7S1LNJ3_ALECA|mmetsp:Transcript_11701/g.31957  ORF Transcript_11701/g.31957 Transcript_11701/m.31957 type:complete len:369 (+) Transcript_11701:60-1166(+)|eukprot:CAMPEP_0171156580 /NCGR_PEP_ID=MMETSP0790-20130122/1515_1 /TAXON_ID=2925 /ORGANISM="Alexandrium catenella, Strain OF101" /LENGTH=368 /DNA_ID=CAMNT_0011620887 /DNA_START=56 /DNA_END=1162 /DNA_ORIENTATION=-